MDIGAHGYGYVVDGGEEHNFNIGVDMEGYINLEYTSSSHTVTLVVTESKYNLIVSYSGRHI